MKDAEALDVVRSFVRFLSLGTVVVLGPAMNFVAGGFAASSVVISIGVAGLVAWMLSGWFARAALRPAPNMVVISGIGVGFLVGIAASIAPALEKALENGGDIGATEMFAVYCRALGVSAALCAVPGMVVGAVLSLFVQARAQRAIRADESGDRCGNA